MTDWRFRLAGPADLNAVAALTEAAYAPWTLLLGGPPVPVTEDYRPRIAKGEVWLLEQDGAFAGLLVAETHADHLMIYSVAVAPIHQGAGHGRRLLDWAQELARRSGVGKMRLYTNARMERNIALYAAYGFRETGRRANPQRPGWTVVDMEMALA